MEYSNGCILHTTGSQLERLDSVQRRFLHGLQINEEIAFQQFNLAPPILRRDIGMLGLLHKIVLGLAHPAFFVLFPRDPAPPAHFNNKALYDRGCDIIFNRNLFNRSLFGLVAVYNRLPQILVDFKTIADFQSVLTNLARYRCAPKKDGWKFSFNSVHPCSWV